MKFGPVPLSEAQEAILAHSAVVGDKRLRKAHRLTADDIAAFEAAGMSEVVVAMLDPDDVDEDEAATRIAAALHYSGVTAKPAATGRVNLFADADGLFTVDKGLIDAINRVDPDVTIATLAAYASVVAGQMVATVKIIPFAVGKPVLDVIAALAEDREIFAVHPFQARTVGVIQTMLPSLKASVLDKTLRVTEERLRRSGSRVSAERRTPHAAADVAEAITELAGESDMVLVFGASAMSDPDQDVIPAAIRASGGTVFRSGMPVDPGNLLVLGERAGKPVFGAPGCARSPKENGFDWVLDRVLSGVGVTADDIAGMGVGGLLMEIPSRPQPREATTKPAAGRVHAVVLAAGRSSRMGGPNKLLAEFGGVPLIRRTAERVRASKAAGVTVVTGHQAVRVMAALEGLDVAVVHNGAFESGLASSLKAGLGALPADADAALVVLGDMPEVTTADLDRLIAAFREAGGRAAVRASHNGKRGNPVLVPRLLFSRIAALEGDTGARHILEEGDVEVIDVEIGESASVDVDTPEALRLAGGVLRG